MPKKKKEEDLPTIYLKQAFEYSAKDDLAGAGMMLRALKACVNITNVTKKISEKEHKVLIDELDLMERRPSEKIAGNIYTLCETFSVNPDEIEMLDKKGNVIGYSTPARLKQDLRNVMDRLTIIGAKLTKTLGIEISIIGKQFEGLGLNE